MGLGDILSTLGHGVEHVARGFHDALYSQRLGEFEMEMASRKGIQEGLIKIALGRDAQGNPLATPEMQQKAFEELSNLAQTPSTKPYKLPKDFLSTLNAAPTPPSGQMTVPGQSLGNNAGAPPPPIGGGDSTPGILQGGANQLPPPPPVTGAPQTLPLGPGASAEYAGPPPTEQNPVFGRTPGLYNSADAARMSAQRAGAITEAQTRGQITPRVETARAAGMDEKMAAMEGIYPGYAAMQGRYQHPTAHNVLLDDGTQVAASAIPIPGQGIRYEVNSQDITNHVVRVLGVGMVPGRPVNVVLKNGSTVAASAIRNPDGSTAYQDNAGNDITSQVKQVNAPATTSAQTSSTSTDSTGKVSSTQRRVVRGAGNLGGQPSLTGPPPNPVDHIAGAGTKPSKRQQQVESYARDIQAGKKTIKDVPMGLRNEVQMASEGSTSMPLQSQERLQEQSAALDNAIDVTKRVQQRVGLLNSMVAAGKIGLATDPGTGHLIVSRLLPLTDEEAKLAADFQSLSEHINVLRGPLGATGFRGPEAFAALMGQRGRLMADPRITAQVLATSLSAMQKIKNVKGHYLNPTPASGGSGGIQIIRDANGRIAGIK